MSDFRPWEGAKSCTGKVTRGAAALLAWLMANRVPPGWSGGIYNCRTVAGGTSFSIHSEGRAVDWMLPVDPVTKRGTSHGHTLVNLLLANAWKLGLQCIIYDRVIWSAASPRGREYKGKHPHYDHLHIELAWAGANNLNLATCVSLLGGRLERGVDVNLEGVRPSQHPTKMREPTAPVKEVDAVMTKLPVVDLKGVRAASSTWVRGEAVKTVQGALVARGHAPADTIRNGRVDGIGGPGTRAAVVAFQRAKGLTPDAVVGEKTWAKLLGV